MKPRILVVDDDTALAEMLTIVLRGEGFDPYVVGDGTWRSRQCVRPGPTSSCSISCFPE